jgi:hypothetical protein
VDRDYWFRTQEIRRKQSMMRNETEQLKDLEFL